MGCPGWRGAGRCSWHSPPSPSIPYRAGGRRDGDSDPGEIVFTPPSSPTPDTHRYTAIPRTRRVRPAIRYEKTLLPGDTVCRKQKGFLYVAPRTPASARVSPSKVQFRSSRFRSFLLSLWGCTSHSSYARCACSTSDSLSFANVLLRRKSPSCTCPDDASEKAPAHYKPAPRPDLSPGRRTSARWRARPLAGRPDCRREGRRDREVGSQPSTSTPSRKRPVGGAGWRTTRVAQPVTCKPAQAGAASAGRIWQPRPSVVVRAGRARRSYLALRK
jgi:hypothetical protein